MKREKNKIKPIGKILFAAQDPGGFNSLAPVIKKIVRLGFSYKVFLAEGSLRFAEKTGIDFIDCSFLTLDKIIKKVDEFAPDIVVVATSDGLCLEKNIVAWAKKRAIFSVALIDFWSRHNARFSNPKTSDHAYIPDIICVVDAYMKKQIIAEGVAANKVKITGNPFFESFGLVKKNNGHYILFASQPFSEARFRFREIANLPIFNEVEIFADIVKILEEKNIRLPILIGFHPYSKNRNKYNRIIKKSKIKIIASGKETEKLIDQADLVIGINTVILFQAAMMGKKVISYQPGIKPKEDPLFSNRLGLSLPAYGFKKLKQRLEEVFGQRQPLKKLAKIRGQYVFSRATDNVLGIINKSLAKALKK